MPAVLVAWLTAEPAISSPAMTKTIASTYCTYAQRDGQAEWAWMNIGMIYPPNVVTNPSTNRAQYSLTLLI